MKRYEDSEIFKTFRTDVGLMIFTSILTLIYCNHYARDYKNDEKLKEEYEMTINLPYEPGTMVQLNQRGKIRIGRLTGYRIYVYKGDDMSDPKIMWSAYVTNEYLPKDVHTIFIETEDIVESEIVKVATDKDIEEFLAAGGYKVN